jgi:glycosyltransferase involved in cell wall biosynthesis
MKILYLVHQFYPDWHSGTEKIILNNAAMMQNSGKKVKIITYSFRDESFYDKRIGNILLKEIIFRGIPVLNIRHKKIPNDIHISLQSKELAKAAEEILLSEAPDVVHVGHPMRVTELVRILEPLQIPCLITLTDFFLICPKFTLITSKNSLCTGPEGGDVCLKLCPEFSRNFLIRRLETAKDILVKAKKIIGLSNFIAGIYKKELADLEISVVNPGLKYSTLKKNEKTYKKGDEITFCYAGSLNHHKGVHIAIDAFKQVPSAKALLKIYGSGSDKFYIQKLQSMAADDRRIEFCGVYEENQISEVFNTVDAVIVPSIWYETYQLVLHEALASDIPVIASDVGLMAEKITDNVTGFLFNTGDTEHLRSVLEKVIKNPETLNDLKKNISREIIPSIEQEAYAYERYYYEVMSMTHA